MITNLYETGYTNHVDMDVHPNGKSAYLIINKKEKIDDKDAYNVRVVEVDIATRKVTRIIAQYRQNIESPGPMGYCSIRCLPNGALFVALSMTSRTNVKEVVAAIDIIQNVIPVFNPTSDNTKLPPVDTEARDIAQQALNKAAAALTNSTQAAIIITNRLDTIAKDLNNQIAALPTKDYVWQNIADRMMAEINALNSNFSSVFENPIFKGYIKALAQTTLLEAIEYAASHTAETSKLRALIEEIKKE